MDMHIDNMVRRTESRSNPDITPQILEQLVDGDERSRARAISHVYFNAARRMYLWPKHKKARLNEDDPKNFQKRVRIFRAKAHKYKLLFRMLTRKYDPPDRAVVEYIDTSADEM